ncbi:40100_t:CDS:2 [Gigaspora margarita]|uniref:40100_t:CDS:1 n=1 Tax=Gigaspora margarita TaxID=4874 RepID=A0ABN7V3A1_GIGMA|nr:40100_t:CDS:2 [Gigaspora margarita]
MRLNGFSVEILMDGMPLQECEVPLDECRSLATQPSCIFDELTGEYKYCESVTFASVLELEKNYSVAISTNHATFRSPIRADLYVDGITDFTCHELIDSSPTVNDGFWNYQWNKIHNFSFDFNSLSNDNHSQSSTSNVLNGHLDHTSSNLKSGGVGTITVYFYKAKRNFINFQSIFEDRPKSFLGNQENLLKSIDQLDDIQYQTKFNEGLDCEITKPSYSLQIVDEFPIAILNIHYRSYSWLLYQGILKYQHNDYFYDFYEVRSDEEEQFMIEDI